MTHLCTVCFQPLEHHPETCELECRHFPPLCCRGCQCRSFEEAHPTVEEPQP